MNLMMGGSQGKHAFSDSDVLGLARYVSEACGLTLIVYLLYDKMANARKRKEEEDESEVETEDESVEDSSEEEEEEVLAHEEAFVAVANAEATENFAAEEFFDTLDGNGEVQSELEKPLQGKADDARLLVNPARIRGCQSEPAERAADGRESNLIGEIVLGKDALTGESGDFPDELDASSVIRKALNSCPDLSDDGRRVDDEYRGQEEEEELQAQICCLQEIIDRTESKVKLAKFDLLRERSRTELLRKEMRVQEGVWGARRAQMEAEAREAAEAIERLESRLEQQDEAFEGGIARLRSALEEAEARAAEKEESNAMLRKDLLTLIMQFNKEKDFLEKSLQEQRANSKLMLETLTRRNEEKAVVEKELEVAKDRLERRGKEKKRLAKEFGRLKEELKQMYRHNERGIRVAQILEHIDGID